jgi:5-methylcytosine-specific restriction endonuclease McrA
MTEFARLGSHQRRRLHSWIRDATNCFYCGIVFDDVLGPKRSADHFIPRSSFKRGDMGMNSKYNIVPACRGCNRDKANMQPEEYLKSSKFKVRLRAAAEQRRRFTKTWVQEIRSDCLKLEAQVSYWL